jgi:putative DNA methylase
VIFASLVDDPGDPELTEDAAPPPPEFVDACKRLPLGKNAADHDTPRQRLFDFIERLVLWESTNDEEVLSTARELIRLSTDGNPPSLLDPFAGGGSIPLEAQRLGLEAHAGDLNPVAVMINKAMIEIPPRFSGQPPVNPEGRDKAGGGGSWKDAAGLAADVRYYGQWMQDQAWKEIGHLYPECKGETVVAWLWTRTVPCPNPACNVRMPLIRSFNLNRKKENRVWVKPKVDQENQKIAFEVHEGKGRGPKGTVNRRGARCLACNTPSPFPYIRAEGQAGNMEAQLMAIITEGDTGRNYYRPQLSHMEIARSAKPHWAPTLSLPDNPRDFKTPNYGMKLFADLFTDRQLVALTTFSDLVSDVRKKIASDAQAAVISGDNTSLRDGGTGARAYAEALSVYLAFAVDRSSDYWSTIATPGRGFIRNTICLVK